MDDTNNGTEQNTQDTSSQTGGYTAPDQGTNGNVPPQQQGYVPPQQGYVPPQQGYVPPQQGYVSPQQGYVPPQPGPGYYPGAQPGYYPAPGAQRSPAGGYKVWSIINIVLSALNIWNVGAVPLILSIIALIRVMPLTDIMRPAGANDKADLHTCKVLNIISDVIIGLAILLLVVFIVLITVGIVKNPNEFKEYFDMVVR